MSACFRTLLLISRVLFASVSLAGNLGPEGGCIRPPCFLILRLRGGVSESRQVGAKDSAGQLGESIENSIAQRGWFEVHRHEGQQERRLRKRREQWEEKVHGRQRAGDSEDGGEEDELSSEGKLSSDRPDAYVKPEPPVETDFKETGLPDWLDPIYDDEDSDEYQEPEVEDSVGGFTDDVAHFDYDGEKNKYSIKWNRVPGLVHVHDHLKELTFSEMEEIERIWDYSERNFGDLLQRTDSAYIQGVDGAALLPWEEQEGRKGQERSDRMLFLRDGFGIGGGNAVLGHRQDVDVPRPLPASGERTSEEEGLVRAGDREAMHDEENGVNRNANKDTDGGEARRVVAEEDARVDEGGHEQDGVRSDGRDGHRLTEAGIGEEESSEDGLEAGGVRELKWEYAREEELQKEAEERGKVLAEVRERERAAMLKEEEERARVEAAQGGGVSTSLEVAGARERELLRREREREAETYAMWPEVAGVCAEGKHPLDYKVPYERILAVARENVLRQILQADDDQLEVISSWIDEEIERQTPRHEKEQARRFKDKFGFLPSLFDEIEGFNSFRTSTPPELDPPPTMKRDDLVVPDVFCSVPEAVWASSDGHRIFVRGGNHTWLGVGRRGMRAEAEYLLETVSKADPSHAYQSAMHGVVMVPPAPTPTPVLLEDEWLMGEFVDPAVESFCLHITGERRARICGRWLLRPNSVGSFAGVEAVYQVNETAVFETQASDEDLLHEFDVDGALCASTIEVRGGPWLMDRCGLRACMCVALISSRNSLVKVRECVVGGISHGRSHLSGAGRATMAMDCRDFARLVLLDSTAEMTGLEFMPALRATGKVQVSVERCVFDRNTFSIGVFDHASVRVRSSLLKGNDQGAFFADERRKPVSGNPPDEVFGAGIVGWDEDSQVRGELGKRDREGRVGDMKAGDSVGVKSGGLRGRGGCVDEDDGEGSPVAQNGGEAGTQRSRTEASCKGRSVREEYPPVREGLGLHPYLDPHLATQGGGWGGGASGSKDSGGSSVGRGQRGNRAGRNGGNERQGRQTGGTRADWGWRARRTIRRDPVFGNVTDGWELGLPGWKNGVPADTVSLVEGVVRNQVGRVPLEAIPDSWRRWGEIGCLASHCIFNGSIGAETLDFLTPHFTGGSHFAVISAVNCSVLGDVWGTAERPGTISFINLTVAPDPWVEQHLNDNCRINSSALLEEWGFRWDVRRRDWRKPLRRVDGSVVYVPWHETRFVSDGVRGGIPGSRVDFPMYDPISGERIPANETSLYDQAICQPGETRCYLALDGCVERVPTQEMQEHLQQAAEMKRQQLLAARAEQVRRKRSWRTFNRDPKQLDLFERLFPLAWDVDEAEGTSSKPGDERSEFQLEPVQTNKELLALGINPEREAAINRLLDKILSRHNLRDHVYRDDLPSLHALSRQ